MAESRYIFMLIMGKAFEIKLFHHSNDWGIFLFSYFECEFHHETHIGFINLFLSLYIYSAIHPTFLRKLYIYICVLYVF